MNCHQQRGIGQRVKKLLIITLPNAQLIIIFISYARKPQAFKPGDEWHPFEASQVKPGEAE
jgi:hypothetical protein